MELKDDIVEAVACPDVAVTTGSGEDQGYRRLGRSGLHVSVVRRRRNNFGMCTHCGAHHFWPNLTVDSTRGEGYLLGLAAAQAMVLSEDNLLLIGLVRIDANVDKTTRRGFARKVSPALPQPARGLYATISNSKVVLPKPPGLVHRRHPLVGLGYLCSIGGECIRTGMRA